MGLAVAHRHAEVVARDGLGCPIQDSAQQSLRITASPLENVSDIYLHFHLADWLYEKLKLDVNRGLICSGTPAILVPSLITPEGILRTRCLPLPTIIATVDTQPGDITLGLSTAQVSFTVTNPLSRKQACSGTIVQLDGQWQDNGSAWFKCGTQSTPDPTCLDCTHFQFGWGHGSWRLSVNQTWPCDS